MLPDNEYEKVIEQVPILCVDGVLMRDGKYLVVLRRNEPLKNEWWVPGGRVYRGESLAEAFIRKMKQETGLFVDQISNIGYYEEVFNVGEHGPIHTVSVVFSAMARGEVLLDDQSRDYEWVEKLPVRFTERFKA